MERDKMLDVTLAQIEKQFGKGAVMRLGEHPAGDGVSVVPTGALALDVALGIGGIPRGRIVEVYGPEGSGKTTVCLHIIAEAQKKGGIAVFIDAEHALDPTYSRTLGVNIDELLVSQPDNGEQALEIADLMVRSGAVDLVVVDSVAALVPRAEIEGEMGDSHVGLQARLMSQAMRKLAGSLSRFDTTAIFINQLREKIGVMFGCLSYGTRVTLADGTQEKIGKIVNQRMPVEVLSYDPEVGAVVPKKVVNWFDNGMADEFTPVHGREGGSATGRSQFTCTPNHQIRTPAGWVEAKDLRVGDMVMTAVDHKLSDFQWQAIRGGLMGDGALSQPEWHGQPGSASVMALVKSPYAEWKASLFANIGISRSTNAKSAVFFDLTPLVELHELRGEVYVDGKKVFERRLPEAPHAALFSDLVHGRRRLHDSRQGTAREDQGRKWSLRDVCRGHVARDAGPTCRVSVRHLGDRPEALPASRQGDSPVPERRDGEAPRAHRALRAPFHGVQAPASIPRPVRCGAGVHGAATRARRDADPFDRAEAEDEEHAPLRHRGGGKPQLPGRWRGGAQQPRDHARRAGAEVLLLRAARRTQDRQPQGRHRRRGLARARQGGQEQAAPRRSAWPSSTSSTGRASPRRAA